MFHVSFSKILENLNIADPIYNTILKYNVIYSCYSNDKVADVSNEAKNDKVIKWLWAVSEKCTKLDSV